MDLKRRIEYLEQRQSTEPAYETFSGRLSGDEMEAVRRSMEEQGVSLGAWFRIAALEKLLRENADKARGKNL